MNPLLQVLELTVAYCCESQRASQVLHRVCFEVGEGEVVGLLGESGCGKTSTALAVLGLLPAEGQAWGSVRLEGQELLGLREVELRKLRGACVSMIFQEPGVALNPVLRVGDQIAEVVAAHRRWERKRCRAAAEEALAEVGLLEVSRIYAAFPHQLSGGQLQRVAIAQALVCRPKLVIADEPTASLDAASRGDILRLLQELRSQRGTAFLLISHQPAVLSALADRILVIHAGQIVETGAARQVLEAPVHPYLRALLESGRNRAGRPVSL